MAPAIATPIWFITGCSSGLGRAAAEEVLARGWRAAVTARRVESIEPLARKYPEAALALTLDVTRPAQISAAVAAAERRFGGIDVLLNNAGYGYQASVEEGEEAQIRALFDANVFGLFALTRAVLPLMRRQRRGHVFNISSVSGLSGFAASGYYAASKHAVEGWADSLAVECNPLGIRVTCVEPGPFRTDWAGRSLQRTPSAIADYADSVGARMRQTEGYSGKQPGDPRRAARLIAELSQHAQPPRNIALGARAVQMGALRLKAKLADIERWAPEGLRTDYED
ncbi:oxidoreductase [Comamonas flocculans]|uniref:SDR family NAD(P)-dependent oxidoreductase n=1 Tax=Comamonas flocculans TaxID=2597701 RepID=A0A5B8RT36_9BURK|nr:oxidoreductase [Comamonas flocculans]QEA11894.1 SDR family NAD(P)-dependent oxidoreductase [Comamonas flocculans]